MQLNYCTDEANMTRWENLLCSIGLHKWKEPKVTTMESYIIGYMWRKTEPVKMTTCSICKKTTIEVV